LTADRAPRRSPRERPLKLTGVSGLPTMALRVARRDTDVDERREEDGKSASIRFMASSPFAST